MNLATSRNFVAALLVAGATLAPGLAAHAAPAADTASDLKAAALARLAQTEPTLVIDHIEIRSIKDDYALAVAYPDLSKNPTDPSTIILHKENGAWKGVGGPGTAFPPGADREGAPTCCSTTTIPTPAPMPRPPSTASPWRTRPTPVIMSSLSIQRTA